VGRIVDAYEKYDSKHGTEDGVPRPAGHGKAAGHGHKGK
jgi:phosphate starvation-inducible PhoH-like protein